MEIIYLTLSTLILFLLLVKLFKVKTKHALAMFFGGLAVLIGIYTLPFFLSEGSILYKNGLLVFFILGFLEEGGKLLAGFLINKKVKAMKNISKTLIFMIFVGLGYAYFENILFLFTEENIDSEFLAYRIVISSFSHIIFSIIAGLFLGLSMFYSYSMIDLKISRNTSILKRVRFLGINKIGKLISIKFILIGLFISTLVHALYNYFLSIDKVHIGILIVAIGVFITGSYVKLLKKSSKGHNYLKIVNKIEKIKEKQSEKQHS